MFIWPLKSIQAFSTVMIEERNGVAMWDMV